jgi:aminoglycoside/choline kinase family phosphotransferase
MNQDFRLQAIHNWLLEVLEVDSFSITPASSDASFRRYFRVEFNTKSWIVMDAPPEKEDVTPFIKIAKAFFKHKINVPEIKAYDEQQGFLLLTDFGSIDYLQQLNETAVDTYYKKAIDSLIQIQLIDKGSVSLPLYDQSLLQKELDLFPEWFLEKHLSLTAPAQLQSYFDLLIANALQQPQCIVHRDFHSRNLMDTPENSPGIIDFQDAVIGPISYDLVSLLRDCYISWPQSQINEWLTYYFTQAQQYDLIAPTISQEQFIIWFDLMGLQRHIKVLGIFCRLNYRDNKTNYLKDLPLTLHYVKTVCDRYPEQLSSFALFLEQNVELPML